MDLGPVSKEDTQFPVLINAFDHAAKMITKTGDLGVAVTEFMKHLNPKLHGFGVIPTLPEGDPWTPAFYTAYTLGCVQTGLSMVKRGIAKASEFQNPEIWQRNVGIFLGYRNQNEDLVGLLSTTFRIQHELLGSLMNDGRCPNSVHLAWHMWIMPQLALRCMHIRPNDAIAYVQLLNSFLWGEWEKLSKIDAVSSPLMLDDILKYFNDNREGNHFSSTSLFALFALNVYDRMTKPNLKKELKNTADAMMKCKDLRHLKSTSRIFDKLAEVTVRESVQYDISGGMYHTDAVEQFIHQASDMYKQSLFRLMKDIINPNDLSAATTIYSDIELTNIDYNAWASITQGVFAKTMNDMHAMQEYDQCADCGNGSCSKKINWN